MTGMYLISHDQKPVAYVETKDRIIIEPKIASLTEQCLLAYGIHIEFGVEDEEILENKRVKGWKARCLKDATTEFIARAISICIAFCLGVKAQVKPVSKTLYEVELDLTLEGDENHEEREEVRFETI